MYDSIASRICAKVIFIAYCVMSQEFHPPMYLQTLKTAVTDRNYKAKPSD